MHWQEYGKVDDNYFGTMEEGQQHLTDLYTELADKKAQLAQLDEDNPEHSELITSLENDIASLNNTIELSQTEPGKL